MTTEAAMPSHTVIIHAYGRHLNNFFINIIIITAKYHVSPSIFNVLLMEQDIFLFRTGIIDFLQQVMNTACFFNQSQPSFL